MPLRTVVLSVCTHMLRAHPVTLALIASPGNVSFAIARAKAIIGAGTPRNVEPASSVAVVILVLRTRALDFLGGVVEPGDS